MLACRAGLAINGGCGLAPSAAFLAPPIRIVPALRRCRNCGRKGLIKVIRCGATRVGGVRSNRAEPLAGISQSTSRERAKCRGVGIQKRTRKDRTMSLLKPFATAVAIIAMSAGVAAAAPAVSETDLNMRSGPGTDHAVIDVIPAGATVEVLDCAGTW